MKKSFLLVVCSVLLINCANKKNTTQNSEPTPEAEVSLAPGQIQAHLKILMIEDNDSHKMVSSEVIEILSYGSATDPVPSGSKISFAVNNELYNKSLNLIKQNNTLVAILSNNESNMMMGDKTKTTLWKLITIKN
ncbi:MAG: hypothetical protein RIC57_05045 [Balneola sp.]|jgi:hypothetical protein